MSEHQTYVDIRHAARVAEVSPRTVRRWMDEGKLTTYRVPISGRVRVSVSELTFLCQPMTIDDERT